MIGGCSSQEKLKAEVAEGWEYAPLFTMQFHLKERKMDLCRRRRWHRKMVCTSASSPCFFHVHAPAQKSDDSSDEEDENAASLTAPRMFLSCHSRRCCFQ